MIENTLETFVELLREAFFIFTIDLFGLGGAKIQILTQTNLEF